jgi:hypothetical protein
MGWDNTREIIANSHTLNETVWDGELDGEPRLAHSRDKNGVPRQHMA